MKEVSRLLRILKNLCAYFVTCLQSGSSVPALIVSLISNYGKHRSRWLLTRLERWVADTYSNSKSLIRVEHLSESNRRLELNHYYNLVREGSRRSQARTSAKQMGHRRNLRSFEHIKRTLQQEVHRLGHHNRWINVRHITANNALNSLLFKLINCLLFRADRRREEHAPGKRKADSISDSVASASARSTLLYSDATTIAHAAASMSTRLPRHRSRMPEDAESTAGGPHPRGSDSLSNMSSMAGGEPRSGIWRSTWSDHDSMVGRSHLRGSDSRSHIDSMAGGAPTRRVANWSDNESMAGGAPCRGVRGQINVDFVGVYGRQ